MKRAEQPQVELKEGISLGGWKLVKELGSGAFGRVFESTHRFAPEGRWILKVAPLLEPPKLLKSGKKPKKPKKPTRSMEGICLNVEREMYELTLPRSPFFARLPPSMAFSTDKADGFRYLPLERLDCNLWELAERYGGTLPFTVAARAAVHIIRGISLIHAQNRLYSDTKPYNFMIRPRDASPADHADVCVTIDMGTCTEIVAMDGSLKPCEGEDGTAKYLSLAKHQGKDLCPRMDYEAVAYMMVELIGGRGSLPWGQAGSRDELVRVKTETDPSELTRALPPPVGKFLQAARSLPIERSVDVDKLLKIWAPHAADSFYLYESGAGRAAAAASSSSSAVAPGGGRGKGKARGKSKSGAASSSAAAMDLTSDTDSDEDEDEVDEHPSPRQIRAMRRRTVRERQPRSRASASRKAKAGVKRRAGKAMAGGNKTRNGLGRRRKRDEVDDSDVEVEVEMEAAGAASGHEEEEEQGEEGQGEDESPPKRRKTATGRASRPRGKKSKGKAGGSVSSPRCAVEMEGDDTSGDESGASGEGRIGGASRVGASRGKVKGIGGSRALKEAKGAVLQKGRGAGRQPLSGAGAATKTKTPLTPGRRAKLRRKLPDSSMLSSPSSSGGTLQVNPAVRSGVARMLEALKRAEDRAGVYYQED